MPKVHPSYRIRTELIQEGAPYYLYNDGNASGHWESAKGLYEMATWWGLDATWSKKGKIFYSRRRLRQYLEQFVNRKGTLDFSMINHWQIEEIGNSIKHPAEFFHTWEHLTGQIWNESA